MGVIKRFISGLKTAVYTKNKNKPFPGQLRKGAIIYSNHASNFGFDFSEGAATGQKNSVNISELTQNKVIEKISNYSFLRSVIEAVEIPITDVIKKSTWDFSLSPIYGSDVDGESRVRSIEREIKEIMSTFDLAGFVRKELTDWLMYGYQIYFLQVESGKIYVSKVISDNALTCFHREKYTSVDLGVISNSSIHSDDPVLSSKYSVPYFFERRVYRNITERQAVEEGLLEIPKDELGSISDYILEFQKFYGVGFLDSVAGDLFNLYLREIVYDWLSMLEIIQPKLIGITINGERFDAPDITKAITDIESMLNDACANLIQAGMGGQNIEPVLYNMLANRYQLIGLTQQSSSIDEIEVTNLNETLRSMQEDIQQKKLYILQNKGIPEELHNGEGNRWEIIARTDKYLDNIKRSCSSIESFVKQFIFSLCMQLGYKEYILSTDQINFNLDFSALTSNYIENSGFSFLSEKLEDLSTLLENTENICEMENVNPDKIKELIAKKIKEIDPAIASAIKLTSSPLDDEYVETVDEIAEEMIDISEKNE